jgi:hypothetical protein
VDTEIEILRRFEHQLTRVAERDARRAASPSPKPKRPWRAAIAVAAALLSLSFVVGLLATGGSVLGGRSAASSAAGFVPNPGPISEPGVALAPGSGQALVGGPAPTPAPIREGQIKAGVTNGSHQGVTTSTGAGPATGQQAASSSSVGQVDLSKIIRDGQIAVTVDDGTFKATAGSVAHIAAVNGGSILSSSTEGGDSGSFTLRVPAANFDKAMLQLAQLGTVDSSASQGQDVTAQYVDLKAHMKIYLSRRRVLFGLMQQATTIGQTLTLQNQLDDVQLKIDQLTGQINYINKQVAESTIKVDLHEAGAAVAASPDAIDNPSLGRAWDRAVQGFLNVLATVVIGLGYLIPLLVVIALGYGIWRVVQRRRVEADADAG